MKFDTKKLEKLNNPERLKSLNSKLIWQSLNLSAPEIIVDIGAGTGFFASHFAEEMKGGIIYACDNSDVMIDYMKENLPQTINCKVIPVKSQENNIPLKEGTADLVYLINVFHELESPEKLLNETLRLLKPGGKIAIIDWKYEKTQDGPPLSHRISHQKIIFDLGKAGYSDISTLDILPFHCFVIGNK